ncbi:LAETG motif-containing sortase-dependent surface protein [Streptomyces anandii]|uniref:LAETG motif-containing sortase-dependent surface protein n=1 Tax=Streptomyces anandii TaxID=285454 RepID=A0ABW6HBT3_9ACTN
MSSRTTKRHSSRRGAAATAAAIAATSATTAAAALGLGLAAAAPASASTFDWSVTCSQVTVDLTGYNDLVVQVVEVTANGKDLAPASTFRDELHKTYAVPAHAKPLAIRVTVQAGSEDGKSFDETKTSPTCDSQPPTSSAPAPAGTPTVSGSTASTATGSTASTGTAPSPNGASPTPVPSTSPTTSAPPLADTGASDSTPLIAAAAAATALAGAALLLTSRHRGRKTRP